MSLSNDLMSQFAKATVDKRVETETTVYGTVVEYNDKYYVKLDGSDRLTPMPATAEALPDDRVSIKIKNHTATITGNVSSPAARVGRVEEIDGKLAVYIPKIEADSAAIKVIESKYVKTEQLDAIEGRFDTLEANDVTINEKLTAKEADIEKLKADFAEFERIDADYAKIKDLEAATGRIDILESDVADIDTLIFGSASGDVIQSSFANMVIAQLGDAQIKSAMIESVSAEKITSGSIITNEVTVMSEDCRLLISDETIQISDENRVRVQIGKDGNNDYSINIWDADGNLMFSEGGITDSAIKDAIIRNDMVSDNANISASKLDIDSLFTEINNSTKTIKATKVYLDEENQTLDVSFKQMVTDVEGLSEDVSSQGTQISVIQGQIDSKVWQQDIDSAKGEMSTKYSTLEQTVEGFKTTVSETYAKKEDLENIDIGDMSIGGRNLLIDTNSAKSVEHIIAWNPDDDYAEIVYHDSYTDIVSTYTGVVQIVPNMTYGWYVFYRNAFVDWLKPDTDYVVSFDIQFSGWNDDTYGVFPQIGIGNTQSQNMQMPYATASEIEPDTGQWARVSCNLRTVALIPEDKPLSEQALCINFGSSTCINNFAIKNLKLEEGTVPTAWTPAPEDNATKGDIETLTTKYAEFEQSVEGFKTTVGETYATKKELDNIDLDVEIGGRNYLIGTSEELQTFTFSGWQKYISNENQNVTTFTVSPDILPKLGQGQKVTLSAFIENVTDTNEVGLMLMVYTPDTDSGYRQYTPMNSDGVVIAPSESGTAYVTTTLDVSTVTSVAIALRHNSATTEESTVNIRSIKLELGDQVTDWTPAPEDTDNALGDLSTETNDSFDNLNDRIVLAESTIQQLKDCISMLVVDENGESMMEQTSTGWTFKIESIQTSLNNVSQNIDTLVGEMGSVEAVVDALNAAVEDLGKTAEYVKIMTYESEPCIALGKKDSVFKLLITNTRIMFLDGDNVPTYINTTGLVTENITVNNELIQNGWVWKVRANGNYGLIWRGDG